MKRDHGRSGPRVLIVMSESLANLVALTLQHGRYESRRTFDAAECRQLIREWEPQLAFLDLDIYPNFIDVFHSERAVVPIPILAFTRKRDTALKLSAFERGVDDIIEVPFTLDEIVARPYALMRRVHRIDVPLVPKIRLDGLARSSSQASGAASSRSRATSSTVISGSCASSSATTGARPSSSRRCLGRATASSRRPSRIGAAKPPSEVAQPLKRAPDEHWK